MTMNKNLENDIKKIIKGEFKGKINENIFAIQPKNLKTQHHLYNYLYENNNLSKYNVIAEYMNLPSASQMSSMIKPEYNMTLQAEDEGFEKNDYVSNQDRMGNELSKIISKLTQGDLMKTAEVETSVLTAKRKTTSNPLEQNFYLFYTEDPSQEKIGAIFFNTDQKGKPLSVSYTINFDGDTITDKIKLKGSLPF